MIPPTHSWTLGLIGNLGWTEVVIVLVLGVLIFGNRLPEVGKSIAKGIVEFKKGLAGVEDDINKASQPSQPKQLDQDQTQTVSTQATEGEKVESKSSTA